MRETQILRGLHKARATMGHNYADGVVPNGPPASGFAGIGTSLSRMFSSAPKPVAAPPAPVATPPSNSGAQAIGEAVAPGAMNAIRNRKAMLDSLADGYAPDELGLRRGAVNIKGPGTTTSDSIHNVSLSKGESVLPAKTTAALGADNIARLIEQTNGKPPARGLRAGGRHAGGAIPGMETSEFFDDIKVPTREEAAERLKKQPRPAMGNTTTAGAGPVQEPAGPQTLKQRATNMFSAGKATVGGLANSAVAPLKTAAAVGKGLGAGALGGYAGGAAAEAARGIGKPTGAPVEPNANGNAIQGGVDVSRIPGASVQQTASAATMPKQQYNYFTDNETGRNVGNTLNAAAMIPGVGPVARSALGMGTGVISRTARAAGNPLVAGALQGAAANIRQGASAQPAATTTAATAANPYAGANAVSDKRQQRQGNQGATGVNPYHGDLTSGINAASKPEQLQGAGIRANDIYRTVGKDGGTVYSGYGDGSGAMGGVVNGDGTARTGKGTFNVMPNDQTSRTLSSGQSGAISAALQAAVARGDIDAVRSFYHNRGETWQGQTKDQYDDERLTTAIANERDPKKLAGLQAAMKVRGEKAQTEAATRAAQATGLREQQRMLLDLRKQGLEELRYSTEQGDKRRAADLETSAKGAKAQDDFMKSIPSLYDTFKDGEAPKLNEKKLAALSTYMAETAPEVLTRDGKRLSLQDAFAMANPDGRNALAKGAGDMALREFAHSYSLDALGGKGTKAGAPKILRAPRASELSDLVKNMHVTDYLATKMPWINSQTIEVEGAGGPIAIPLKEIMARPDGRELMDAILRNSPDKK